MKWVELKERFAEKVGFEVRKNLYGRVECMR